MLLLGLPFALALLTILGCHEFGHYLMGRHHGVHLTLPYFIPFPLPPFGTMGAVINMKEPPKNRNHLLDIGLAGPFAGLIIGIPILLLGLSLSNLEQIPTVVPQGSMLQLEGNSLLYLFLKFLMFGRLLPAPVSFAGSPEWLYWVRYFFTGRPAPLGAMDVTLNPVAFAAWGGIFVTALNLIPAGQLDGGHVTYVLLGRKKSAAPAAAGPDGPARAWAVLAWLVAVGGADFLPRPRPCRAVRSDYPLRSAPARPGDPGDHRFCAGVYSHSPEDYRRLTEKFKRDPTAHAPLDAVYHRCTLVQPYCRVHCAGIGVDAA